MTTAMQGGAPRIEPTRAPERFGERGTVASKRTAEAPRAPALTRAEIAAKQEQESYLRTREAEGRRSMLRGLIVLAVLVLLISLFHAGADRAFPAGWLRRW